MKISEVQPYLREMFKVEAVDPSLKDQLREENSALYDEIFDLQDRVLVLEKELAEIREDL